MSYEALRSIALAILPHADACYDCGGVLHFICESDAQKGADIAVIKQNGEITPFVMAIEDGLVGFHCTKLDFATGAPV